MVLWSVRKGDGGSVDDLDLTSTPEVALGNDPLCIGDEGGMDVVEHLDGQEGACLTVGAVLGGRKGVSRIAAKSRGLSDRLTAGGAGLGDLPEEGPEGEPEGPASAAGMGTFLTLGEEVIRNPAFEEELELVEEGALARGRIATEADHVSSEVRTEGREVRGHIRQLYYCPIDRNAKLLG